MQNDFDVEVRAKELELQAKGKRKKVILFVVIGFILAGLCFYGFQVLSTGMNDQRIIELNARVAQLEQTIEYKNDEIKELEEAVKDTTVREVVPITSLQRVEATEVPQLDLIEGDFIAPNIIEIPTAKDDINNSHIQVGSRFKFFPSDSWIMVSKGTTVEFSHPTKIWGKIKAITVEERVPETDMQDIVREFFVGYPATTITYRKVYVGDYLAGMLGEAEIEVNLENGSKKSMILTTGFLQRGNYGLNILFVYDTDNIVGKELLGTLLNAGTFGDNKIILE